MTSIQPKQVSQYQRAEMVIYCYNGFGKYFDCITIDNLLYLIHSYMFFFPHSMMTMLIVISEIMSYER